VRTQLASLLIALGLVGCGAVDTAPIELAWQLVDRNGDPIPAEGPLDPLREQGTCGLGAKRTSPTSAGVPLQTLRVDLRVELQICDPSCAAGCGDPTCLVTTPARFPCRDSRGSEQEVPVLDPDDPDPYQFQVRAVLVADDRGDGQPLECVPRPDCIATPGPRERTLEPGRVADLAVFEFQLAVDTRAPASDTQRRDLIDLDACGCIDADGARTVPDRS